jgi:hypothetical protein
VFADGYYEGEPSAVEAVRRRRAIVAEDVKYWIGVLEQLPAGTDDAVRAFLRDRIVGRAVPDSEHSSIQESLRSFATETTPHPPGWLRAVLGHLKTEAGRYLAVLERPLTTSNVVPAGMVVSVQLTAGTASRSQSYNVVVQNTATKPIEVLRFGYLLDGEQHSRRFNRITFGPAPMPGQGPLQPGEAREFPASSTRNPDGSLPRVEPVFVLFQDSTFIGSPEELREVLEEREQRVADATFWIGVLDEIAARPLDKVRAMLEARLRERTKLDALSPHPGFNLEIKDLLRTAQTRPAGFAAAIERTRATLERYRAYFSHKTKQ